MKRVLLTSAAVLMSLSMAALAETTPSQTSSTTAAPPHSSATTAPANPGMASSNTTSSRDAAARDAASAPHVTANSSDMFASVPPSDELSSKVVGLEVYNSQNQDIGKIKDIAFDPQGGVKAYIVAVGGFLGMGDRYVAVNPSAIHVSYDSNAKKWHAAMNTDSAQLKSAPEYKYSSND